jgi:GT2 family glycosyltransferase
MSSHMTDEALNILMESKKKASSIEPDFLDVIDVEVARDRFDEIAYLRAYPDVAQGIADGVLISGYDHYTRFGKLEGRKVPSLGPSTRNRLIKTSSAETIISKAAEPARSVEALLVSNHGGIMIVGWIDDAADPLEGIAVVCSDWRLELNAQSLVRVRRPDVENALQSSNQHSYGFIGFYFEPSDHLRGSTCVIELATRSGLFFQTEQSSREFNDMDLRNVALSHIAEAKFFSNYQVEAVSEITRGFGDQIVALNRFITNRVKSNPYIVRFGNNIRPIYGSIVVCLYGRAEYMFLQAALFSKLPGIENYEFIYVSNSPELSEVLLREARNVSSIYDIRITLVLLTGNAGFGGANNAAVDAARSNRILNVNPDVFPYDPEWASKHTALINDLPKQQTALFGVPLYYDDGSLMHGGMHFEIDNGVLMRKDSATHVELVRVEHYGKGAPDWAQNFTQPRPIPAITGAFISSNRAWYEKLGGFTEDYVFGHYEDADLCLKSLEGGVSPWMHDIRLWHLEGKGSTRRPVHEGGSLINRWLFSKRWTGLIKDRWLLGNLDHQEERPSSQPAVTTDKVHILKPKLKQKSKARTSSL